MRFFSTLMMVSTLALGAVTGCTAASNDDAAAAAADLTGRERAEIMDALRAQVKPDLGGQDIVFNVSDGHFGSENGWTWMQGTIELRGGGEPSIEGTFYEEYLEEGGFDGWRFEALLKKDGDVWTVLEHSIGSTDVWYANIRDSYPDAPESIFPPWMSAPTAP